MPTPNLGLPYIGQGQAQKEVTHNEALNLVDVIIQLSVKSRSLSAPPVSPVDGDRYLVAAGPTGAWTGHADEIAHLLDGSWRFVGPKFGWRLWVQAENALFAYDGTMWRALGPFDSLELPAIAAPAAPTADKIKVFAQNVGGRPLLAQRGPLGLASPVQPFLGQRRISHWMAAGGSLGTTVNGAGSVIVTGSTNIRTPTSTRFFTSMRRLNFISAGAAGSSCGLITHNGLVFWRGNAAGFGGFHAIFTFGVSEAATLADGRLFVGLHASAAPIGNVNPSALTNLVGIGCDSGETSLSVISNDGAGAATKTNLGADFPSQTLSVDWYELSLYAAPNAASIFYRLARLNTGHITEGELTADLPDQTSFMAPHVWRNNGTTAAVARIDIGSVYVETDY